MERRRPRTFTRINIGKIPLTNAELIKVLLLRKDNFPTVELHLQQLRIAKERDEIEQRLQDDSLWYFLRKRSATEAGKRIGYLFDLMAGQEGKKSHDPRASYFWFYNRLAEAHGEAASSILRCIDGLWLEVKRWFQTLLGWYEDHTLYHLIGYLVEYGGAEFSFTGLAEEVHGAPKDEFLRAVERRVGRSLKKREGKELKDIDVLGIGYEDRQNVGKMLLLFNLHTILDSKRSDMRFPLRPLQARALGY
ncbi:MAG: hypothetical protein CSA97_02805 [Bacteroidetes bacterium]|nr:MAG: hypothetical protein CSA97_02805 [Bacteroidota bacterium]